MNKNQKNSGLGKDNILQNRFTAYVEKALTNNRLKYIAKCTRYASKQAHESLGEKFDEERLVAEIDSTFDAAFGLEIDSLDDLRLFSALRSLDRKDLIIIKLHIFYEYPFEKIAVVMGMTVSAVRSRYNRAIYRIRARMEDFK